MNGNQYQELAMRTNDGMCTQRLRKMADFEMGYGYTDFAGIVNACFGLSGEVGEINDMVKKWVFHGHKMDKEELEKEIGDVMWYVALICTSLHIDLEEVMGKNIDKLKKRYPEGFSEKASVERSE